MDTFDSLQSLTIKDLPHILRRYKVVVAACTLLGSGLGALKAAQSRISYQSNLLMRIEERDRMQTSDAEITRLTEDFRLANPTEGEIEIVKSRSILAQVVKENGLGLTASPKLGLVRRLLHRNAPRLVASYFYAPDTLTGYPLVLQVDSSLTGFRIWTSDGRGVLRGRFGQTIDSTSNWARIHLLLSRQANCKPGQRFELTNDIYSALNGLSDGLTVEQIGKQTGLLNMRLVESDPQLAALELNAVAETYIKQIIQRRSDEAAIRQASLERQIPSMLDSLTRSEEQLQAYKRQVGMVNADRTVDQVMGMQDNIDRQILDLMRRRKETLEHFTAGHPSIRIIDSTIAMLQAQRSAFASKIHDLPAVEQEITRLDRIVQANSERYRTILREANQLRLLRDQQVANVQIVDRALPGKPLVKRGKGALLAIGLFAGLCVGTGIAIGLRVLDPGVGSASLIEQILQTPVVGLIPHSKEQRALGLKAQYGEPGIHLLAAQHPTDLAMEALRTATIPLRRACLQAGGNSIAVTGPSPNSTKSMVAANLAALLAQPGNPVVLVDADLRLGRLHQVFGLEAGAGLTGVLQGSIPVEEAILATAIPGLFLLPNGICTDRSTELLQAGALEKVLAKLSASHSLVVIDTPPVLAVADSLLVAARSTIALAVLKHGVHPVQEIGAFRKLLESAGAKLAGAVLNDIPFDAPLDGLSLSKLRYSYRSGG